MRRRIAWIVAFTIQLVVIQLVVAGPLLAHARLKSSSPAAGSHLGRTPTELRLDFSESPELAFTIVHLLDRDGRAVDLAPLAYAAQSRRSIVTRITGRMAPGIYRVTWQVAGDDGHPVRGRFEFVVAPGTDTSVTEPAASATHHDPVAMPEGNGFGAESTPYVAVRWLAFVSLLLVVGAVTFRALVLQPLTHPSTHPGSAMFLRTAKDLAARLGGVAVTVLGVTLVLRLFVQSYAMHGAGSVFDASVITSMLTQTIWGWGWLLQLGGVLLATFGFHRAQAAARHDVLQPGVEGVRSSRWWLLASAGAVAAAFSPAFSGHAASVPKYRTVAMVADGLHVLGASSWLGTLAVLLIAGLAAAARQPAEVRALAVRSLVNRFSPVALTSAGLAVITGGLAAWMHVGTIGNLWGTRYGLTLIAKLAVLGIVSLTGFYNWRFVQPRLGTDEATARLERSARIEVAIAIVVLLVTAVLVGSPTSLDMQM
jgi:copper transport protein